MKILDYQIKKNKAVLTFETGKVEIPLELFIIFKIEREKEISEAEYLELTEKSLSYFAKEKALSILSFGMNSEKMVRDKLRQNGYRKTNIEYALNFCKEYNIVNDKAYAKAYIDTYKTKFGSLKLKNDLDLKGISKEITEELLNDKSDEDEQNEAINCGLKYAKNMDLNELKNLQKLMRHLISRGFRYEDVKAVVEEVKRQKAAE